MRSAYQQMVCDRGQHKGFSSEGVANLIKIDTTGPLDNSKNDQRTKDWNMHQMSKISNKIQSTQQQLHRDEKELEYWNNKAQLK